MEASKKTYFPAVITIAGSDSGGGAGIQADLRTFNAFGVFGCSAICAVTSQNPLAVNRIDLLSPEAVYAQITTVRQTIKLAAAKTGMLGGAGIIEAAVNALAGFDGPIVVDPVMISTSGAALLEPDAVRNLVEKLLPIAAWITPNIPEAEVLTGMKISSYREMLKAARICTDKWGCGCILKGGHLPGAEKAVDIIACQSEVYELSTPVIELSGPVSHGTGCTLSAAFASALAQGYGYLEAARLAKAFVYGSLQEYVTIGENIPAMYPPQNDWQQDIVIDVPRGDC